MKNFLKPTLLLLFGLSFLGIRDFCRNQTHGFSLSKTISSCKHKEELQLTADELQPIQQILNQPFYFMKKGFQCYAFVSQDEKYVLKLLNWKPIEAPFWALYIPNSWVSSILNEKKLKKDHDFTSYKIAFEELKEETGLIYLHLGKTKGLNTSICIYDPIKVQHIIPADNIEFILQKKADLFLSYFEKNKNDDKKMFSFFSHFVSMLQNRAKKNIRDSDISLEHNMGVFEGKPILFDIGNLTQIDNSDTSNIETLHRESKLVLDWLRLNSPKLASYLSQKIELTELNNKDTQESP